VVSALDATSLDPLARMLTRLKLTAIRDTLDSLLDEAARRELSLRVLGDRAFLAHGPDVEFLAGTE
jgi:hypothetical protein